LLIVDVWSRLQPKALAVAEARLIEVCFASFAKRIRKPTEQQMPGSGKSWNAERSRTASSVLFRVSAWLLFLCIQAPLKADTLILNSGEVLEGRILSETDTRIEIEASLYHGTILSKREVPKTDIKSIIRESVEQKQEKAAYAVLGKYTLNPTQELTKTQYATGIAAFEKFLATYTNSASAAEIDKRLADWRAEVSNVASGKVKFADTWMTPEEKKAQADRWQRQADVQAAQNALQSLKKQLADLQGQRGTLTEGLAATQAKLAAAQARLPALQDSTGSASDSGGRRDLAGRLTAGVIASSQRETAQQASPNPERARLQSDMTSYQQQISQTQGTLASLDEKIRDVQSQIPQREQDSKSALARLSEMSTQGKTGVVQNASAMDIHASEAKGQQPAAPTPAPTPPWYMRAWKWIHGSKPGD
jgi:peptidoglycan hydrolase CwlO-like protein